jgi:hypothetical protein
MSILGVSRNIRTIGRGKLMGEEARLKQVKVASTRTIFQAGIYTDANNEARGIFVKHKLVDEN